MARILAVDDQLHMNHIIATWLGRNGHEVVRACDGQAALELLRSADFDLLITDVDMPRMDGLTLISQEGVVDGLRAVVVLTGRHDYNSLDVTVDREKVRFLPKPFSPSKLAQLVQELLERTPAASAVNAAPDPNSAH